MPTDINEDILGFENIEDMLDKCVSKLRNILGRWRRFIVDQDHKELLEVIEYQVRIKQQIKLVYQSNQEFERIDQEDLTSSPWQYLGHGAFGDVYKAKMKGAEVAVKILQTIYNPAKLNEGRILRLLRHDNIVAYRGMDFLIKDLPKYNLTKESFMIIMEYIPDNLSVHVEQLKTHEVQGLPRDQVWNFGEQIMSGLYYLHSFSIAHRDLKPDNILLEKGVNRMRLKLADFGLALREENLNSEGKLHNRWCAPEFLGSNEGYLGNLKNNEVELFMKGDIFSYGLVLHFMLSGDKPWAIVDSHVATHMREDPDVCLPEYPEKFSEKEALFDIYNTCLCYEPDQRPTAEDVIKEKFQAHVTNPYTVAMQTAEFFTCGFLKETHIVVADSLVDEYLGESRDYSPHHGYPSDCLSCEVEIDNDHHNNCPFGFPYEEQYNSNHDKWRNAAMDKEIDDNPNIALKGLTTPREGEEEEQRVVLKFAQATYVHHRAMRDVWRDLDGYTKSKFMPCKTSVHPVFSTSFGLHVAVITADQPPLFLFTRRAKRGGMASPGNYTCGAVESCSTKDYVKRGDKTCVDLKKTAARGLEEELGLVLNGKDLDAICLTTVYLKYDNHEWGMCGFVDLSDERISPEHRLTFASLKSRFTGGSCKDKFEHDQVVPVPFELHKMAHFVRKNFHEFASSSKLVVVKVMQSFFGVAQVEKIFKALDSSD